MTLFMLPAGIALFLKGWILFNSRSKPWASGNWIGFVVVLAMLNLSELLIYAGHSSGLSLSLLLKSYYVCCVMGLIYGYFYVMDARSYSIQKYLSKVVAVIGGILVPIILFSDVVVGQYTLGTFPVVATKGEFFWFFGAFTLSTVALSMMVLLYNYRKAEDPKQQIAYAYTIWGVALLVVSISMIIVLMMLGINTNGTGIIPIATTVFLLVTAQGKVTHLIGKDPRRLNPRSNEAATAKLIDWVQTQSALNNVGLKDAVAYIEAALIQYKLDKNGGNISETARQFGVARSTLNKKLGRVSPD